MTTVTTEATTMPATTTTQKITTEPDVSVITFDPNQTPTCNCSQPKLVKTEANITFVKDEKIVNSSPRSTSTKSPPSASTTSPSPANTTPAQIKIDVKNIISFIDLILSYLNLTRTSP